MRAKELEKERLLQVERGLSQEEKDCIAREKQEAEDARQLAIFMAEKAEAERLRQQRKQDEWEAFQKEGLSGRCRAAQAEMKDDEGTWTWSCKDWGGEGRRDSGSQAPSDNSKHFSWVDEYDTAPEYFSGSAEDQKMFEKLALEPIRKACVVALQAAVDVQGRVNRMLERVLPLIWKETEQKMLIVFKAEVETKAAKGKQKKRKDKGKFQRGAEFAVISAPGNGSKAEEATLNEYDWWWNAIENRRNVRKLDYAFTCVWLDDQKGHCTDAGSCKSGVVPHDADWLCRHLAAAYNCAAPAPACGNCSWMDPWSTAVMHCESDDQDLRFAFLEQPVSPTQPEFECTAKGFEGKYYVGSGQKIELEWAQNRRGLVVKPITKMNMIALDVAEAVVDATKRLRSTMSMHEDAVLDVGDLAYLNWKKSWMVGAEVMEMKAEKELADTKVQLKAFMAKSVRKLNGKLTVGRAAWGKSGRVSKEAQKEVEVKVVSTKEAKLAKWVSGAKHKVASDAVKMAAKTAAVKKINRTLGVSECAVHLSIASGERSELGALFAEDEKADNEKWKGTSLQVKVEKKEKTKDGAEFVTMETKSLIEYNYVKEDSLFGLKFDRLGHQGARVLESVRPSTVQDENLGGGREWAEDYLLNCIHKKSRDAAKIASFQEEMEEFIAEAAEDFSFPSKPYFSTPGFKRITEGSDSDEDEDEAGVLPNGGRFFASIGLIMHYSTMLDRVYTSVLKRVTEGAMANKEEHLYMQKVLNVLDCTAHEVLYQPLSCEELDGLVKQSEKASHELAKLFTGQPWIDKVVNLGTKNKREINADAKYLYEKTEGDGKYGALTNKFRRCTDVARIVLVFDSFERLYHGLGETRTMFPCLADVARDLGPAYLPEDEDDGGGGGGSDEDDDSDVENEVPESQFGRTTSIVQLRNNFKTNRRTKGGYWGDITLLVRIMVGAGVRQEHVVANIVLRHAAYGDALQKESFPHQLRLEDGIDNATIKNSAKPPETVCVNWLLQNRFFGGNRRMRWQEELWRSAARHELRVSSYSLDLQSLICIPSIGGPHLLSTFITDPSAYPYPYPCFQGVRKLATWVCASYRYNKLYHMGVVSLQEQLEETKVQITFSL
jgi:hypothetical protein